MGTGEQDTAVVRAVYEAFGRGDVAAIMALVAPDATVQQSPAVPWGGTYTGHAGLGEFLTALTGHLDSRPETERLFADGDGHVVQVGRTRGTVRATGAGFDVAEVHVWTVRDGLVQRYEAYLDTPAMRAALDRPALAEAGGRTR
jgi:ketosteroid isomerase-like protein